MDHVRVLSQISVVAALFYLDNSRKIRLWGVRACQLKDAKRRVPQREAEREREKAHTHVGERECTHVEGRKRERESAHARGRERESTCAHVGERKHACTRGRERERAYACGGERDRKRFGSSFMFFPSLWACPMQIGLSQECCLSYLRSSLWSSDLLLTFLCSIFTGFSLPCLLATAILDSFSLF